MKILYFIEPWVELSWPGFRFGSLNNYLYKEIDALTENGHDVCLLIGDGLEFEAKNNNFNLKKYKYKVIRQKHLRKIASDYTALYSSNDEKKIEAFANLYKSCLDGFVPDVVMMWECKSDAIKKSFPQARHIHSNYGAMSRAPFPSTQALDVFGIFGSSYISKLNNIKDTISVEHEDYTKFSRLKNKIRLELSNRNPFRKMDLLDKGKYSKVILVPLQVSDYFAFEEYSNTRGQFDYLCGILDTIPTDIRVVVTEHGTFSSIFTSRNIGYLKSKYPNFFYHERFRKFKTSSQYLLTMVDGVISCTSSIGLQAAMLDIPVYFSEKSPFKVLSTCNTYRQFINKLGKADLSKGKDKLFIHLITKYWFLQEAQVHNNNWIDNYINYISGSEIDDLFYVNSPFKTDIDAITKKVKFVDNDIINNSTKKRGVLSLSKEVAKFSVYEKYYRELKSKNWVSFDIFDTLITRSVFNPKDIFTVVGSKIEAELGIYLDDFKSKRVAAEVAARKLAQENNIDEVTFDEIYLEFQRLSGLDDFVVEKIKDLEIECEVKFTGRRESGISLYEKAISSGKKVYLISDMYLSKEQISKLLNKNGILFEDKALFVSSEVRLQKRNGKLFDYFLECEGLEAKNGLHIGDNHRGDGSSPLQKGIKSIVIPKTIDCAKESRNFHDLIKLSGLDLQSNIIVTNIINRVFDYYTDKPCGFYNKNHSNFGYAVLGPMLLGYCIWLNNRIKEDGIDTINFLSRDGKLFKKAFDLFSKGVGINVLTNYLYASRRSINVPCVQSDADIETLVSAPFAPCKLDFFLKYRVGFSDSKIKELSSVLDLHREVSRNSDYLKHVVSKIKDDIKSNSENERKALEVYLSNQPIHTESSAIMDIGYRGSMQRSLQNILGKNVKGYYLITTDESSDIDARAYLAENEPRKNGHKFWRGVAIAEWLTLDSDTSVEKFHLNSNGKVDVNFYEKSSSDEQRGEFTCNIHNGALEFISDYLAYCDDIIPVSDSIVEATYLKFLSNPSINDALMFEGKILEDNFGGSEKRYLVSNMENIVTGKKLKSACETSAWKPGSDKIRDSYQNYFTLPTLVINAKSIPFHSKLKKSQKLLSVWTLMKDKGLIKVRKS